MSKQDRVNRGQKLFSDVDKQDCVGRGQNLLLGVSKQDFVDRGQKLSGMWVSKIVWAEDRIYYRA